MRIPSAILFVNEDISANVKKMLMRQLFITDTLTGQEFDVLVLNNPDYVAESKLAGKRILVSRSFEEMDNRDLADIAIFIRNGLAAVEDKKVGPHAATFPIVNLTWGKLGLFVKPTTAYVLPRYAVTLPNDSTPPVQTSWNLIQGLNFPLNLTVDGDYVYWTELGTIENNYTDGYVKRKSIIRPPDSSTDNEPETLASNQNYALDILVNNDIVYWIADDTIYSCPTIFDPELPIPITTVASNQGLLDNLYIDNNFLYWNNSFEIKRLDLYGTTEEIIINNENGINNFIVDNGFIYWISSTSVNDGKVQGRSILGGPTILYIQYTQDVKRMSGILVQSNNIFWTNNNRIWMKPLTNDIPEVSIMEGTPYKISTGPDSYIYSVNPNTPGSIGHTTPYVGGSTFIKAYGLAYDLFVDSTYVYWISTAPYQELSNKPNQGAIYYALISSFTP